MYEWAGVSVVVVPGALLLLSGGATGRPAPIRAPPRTQRATNAFSAGIRMRRDCPRYAGESCPGIHGGIRPSSVMTRMASACAAAVRAFRSENGAIPPGVWQPAHFSAKIGATFAQVGTAVRDSGRESPEEPVAIAAAATATAATAMTARTDLGRLTTQS